MTNAAEKRLKEILRQLPPERMVLLLEFAEFLAQRASGTESASRGEGTSSMKPIVIPRPPEESVVKAVQRLRATYPMLDPRPLLSPTSELVTQHMLHGREAVEVIDELEVLFRTHFERLTGPGGGSENQSD